MQIEATDVPPELLLKSATTQIDYLARFAQRVVSDSVLG